MTYDLIKQLAEEIVNENDIAMVTTVGARGFPYTRAMKKMHRDGFKEFDFVTRDSSEKVKQIRKNSKGSIYFYDRKNYRSVTFIGRFKITANHEYGISDIYTIDAHDPFQYCTLKFYPQTMRVYSHYETEKLEVIDNN